MLKLIEELRKMREANVFPQYIEYIQFPYFRNLEEKTKITFDFPLTLFVGQNGAGKSSTLHALYGSPEGKTPYDFWFSTVVDPVKEVSDRGKRHSFFYAYKNDSGNYLEVLKTRATRENNPDYWETSIPLKGYGMKKLSDGIKRNPPLEKKVIYIDFRAELSAFDKYFYFEKPGKHLKSKRAQDFLRNKSRSLRKLIDGKKTILNPKDPFNKIVIELNTEELEKISFILGRKYISGKIIEHKLFHNWGISIYFQTNFGTYSEAFAGSGEMATVRLVQEVLKAKSNSLILLDEPEVSLHPEAQQKLKIFLLEQIKYKKLQVIISTHSPNLVEGLPANAIKVFTQLPNGKFHVDKERIPEEAFYFIGHSNSNKRTIIVEDCLAKDILEAVMIEMDSATSSLFDIEYHPGGESNIKKAFLPVFCQESKLNKYIFFDGDQKLSSKSFDPDSIPQNEQTILKYAEEIKKETNCDVKFNIDGNHQEGGRDDQLKELQYKYLKFWLSNVKFLPSNTPEEIIWNPEAAKKYLETIMGETELVKKIKEIEQESDYKQKFRVFSKAFSLEGSSNEISSVHKFFIKAWLKKKGKNYNLIKNLIQSIKPDSVT